jgi:predicted Fe-Mo cluster-binding NifX family protein
MVEQSDTSTSLEILIPVSQFAPQFYMTVKPTFKRAPELLLIQMQSQKIKSVATKLPQYWAQSMPQIL